MKQSHLYAGGTGHGTLQGAKGLDIHPYGLPFTTRHSAVTLQAVLKTTLKGNPALQKQIGSGTSAGQRLVFRSVVWPDARIAACQPCIRVAIAPAKAEQKLCRGRRFADRPFQRWPAASCGEEMLRSDCATAIECCSCGAVAPPRAWRSTPLSTIDHWNPHPQRTTNEGCRRK